MPPIQRCRRHIAETMRRHLPAAFPAAADVIVRSLGPELERSDSFGMAPVAKALRRRSR